MDEHPPRAADQLARLLPGAFRKADSSPDLAFYTQPRFITHIDAGAIAAVTAFYRKLLPLNGDILDLMSSWVSHLPLGASYRSIIGHGMYAAELFADPRLTVPRPLPQRGAQAALRGLCFGQCHALGSMQ